MPKGAPSAASTAGPRASARSRRGALTRLRTDRIDLFYQHLRFTAAELAEVDRTFAGIEIHGERFEAKG